MSVALRPGARDRQIVPTLCAHSHLVGKLRAPGIGARLAQTQGWFSCQFPSHAFTAAGGASFPILG
jgi:hypothetical protein